MKERLPLITIDFNLDFVHGDDDWSDYLGCIQYKYNFTPNRMTSYAPATMVFGRDPFQKNAIPFDPMQYTTIISNISANGIQMQARYDAIRKANKDKISSEM
eukprot:65945_1